MKGQMNIKTAPLKVQAAKNFHGSTVNPKQPSVSELSPRGKSVPIAPKINEGTGGKPAGDKRIINTEDKPAGRDAAIGKSTFRAPRKDVGNDPTANGYTRIGMDMGAKGNGRGNGNR